MTNADSGPFQDLVPSISSRENERGTQIGNGWDPRWHLPTDLYAAMGAHTLKAGLQETSTWLAEQFQTALTDPTFNTPCFTPAGALTPLSAIRSNAPPVSSSPMTDFFRGCCHTT